MNESYLWSRHGPTACLYLSKINGMDVGVFSKRNRPKKYSGSSVIRDVIHVEDLKHKRRYDSIDECYQNFAFWLRPGKLII